MCTYVAMYVHVSYMYVFVYNVTDGGGRKVGENKAITGKSQGDNFLFTCCYVRNKTFNGEN